MCFLLVQLRHYPPHRRLLFCAVPSMPHLEATLDLPTTPLLKGELWQGTVRLHNTGTMPLKGLKGLVSHPDVAVDASRKAGISPAAVAPHSQSSASAVGTDANSAAAARDAVPHQTVSGGTATAPATVDAAFIRSEASASASKSASEASAAAPAAACMLAGLQVAGRHPLASGGPATSFTMDPSLVLHPGEAQEYAVYLHPRGVGRLHFQMVWYYEPEGPGASAQLRYRTLRCAYNLQVRARVWFDFTVLGHRLP